MMLLLPLMALAADYRPLDSRYCRSDGRSRTCNDPGTGGSGAASPPLLALLTADGAGTPTANPSGICDNFSGELVGESACVRGDGASTRGPGVLLAPSGNITTTTPRVCPNGPNCAPVTVQTFSGVGAFTGNQDRKSVV